MYAHTRALRAHRRGVLEHPRNARNAFSGEAPAREFERAQDLRKRIMLMVQYQAPNSERWTPQGGAWAAWWSLDAEGKHIEHFDDWCTALACQQPAEALSIARDVMELWERGAHARIATQRALMEAYQQKPTIGWIARIAAKMGRVE